MATPKDDPLEGLARSLGLGQEQPRTNPAPERSAAPAIANRMHPSDTKFLANIGIPAAILVGIGVAGLGGVFAGWPHVGAAFSVFGFGGALAMRLRLVETTSPTPQLTTPLWRSLLVVGAIATWAFVSFQGWIWWHRVPTVQGYTQAQLDDYAAKKVTLATRPLNDQIEKLTKEIEGLRQGSPETAKIISGLRAQIAQLQSDKPISVDKLPTSLRVVFNSNGTYTQIEEKDIAAWEPVTLATGQGGLITRPPIFTAFVIVFRKPIIFDDFQVVAQDMTSGIRGEAVKKDPHFAVVAFNSTLPGLVDIIAQSKH